MAYSDGAVTERLPGKAVSWTYFSVLGVTPQFGRDFTDADAKPGGPLAVIVSHRFWQDRLAGRADRIGRPIQLDGGNYTVVGVLPASVGPLERGQEFFAALSFVTPPRKGPFFLTVLARLRRDGNRATAAEELHAINRRLFPIWRASYQDDRATWSMMDLQTYVTGDVTAIASLALVAVALVWLIACTNASNLLIARVTSRRRELSVRAALGASRGRVVRYLLTESLLLAIGAAAIGIALAWLGAGLLRDLGAAYFPRTQEIALDGPVRWLLAGLTAVSALLFGLVPAVHGSGGPAEDALRSAGRWSTGTVGVRRLRRVLVASQFAITTPLLLVAGLLLASLNQLGRVALGFDTHNVLTGSILLPQRQYRIPVSPRSGTSSNGALNRFPAFCVWHSATGVHRMTSATSTTSISRIRRRRREARSRLCRGSPCRPNIFNCSASTSCKVGCSTSATRSCLRRPSSRWSSIVRGCAASSRIAT